MKTPSNYQIQMAIVTAIIVFVAGLIIIRPVDVVRVLFLAIVIGTVSLFFDRKSDQALIDRADEAARAKRSSKK